tara:strand:- start:141 stop:755 length:615 start_codon:yes stop_codon:yes gene_type:complete
MEIFSTLLNFASENLYGMAILLLPIYGIFWLLRKVFPRSPNPLGVVLIIGVLGIFTLPSIPRYFFEQEILQKLEQNKNLKLIHSAKWGAIIEPLTWFYSPIGSFYIVGPSGIAGTYYKKDESRNSFRTLLFRYKEDPQFRLVDADCKDRTVWMSGPDKNGTYRYLTRTAMKMFDVQVKTFCEEDYTEQMAILREMILNPSKNKN